MIIFLFYPKLIASDKIFAEILLVMAVYRNKENKQLKKDFDNWKKQAQAKIKLFKQGKLDEDTLYRWMIENK